METLNDIRERCIATIEEWQAAHRATVARCYLWYRETKPGTPGAILAASERPGVEWSLVDAERLPALSMVARAVVVQLETRGLLNRLPVLAID